MSLQLPLLTNSKVRKAWQCCFLWADSCFGAPAPHRHPSVLHSCWLWPVVGGKIFATFYKIFLHQSTSIIYLVGSSNLNWSRLRTLAHKLQTVGSRWRIEYFVCLQSKKGELLACRGFFAHASTKVIKLKSRNPGNVTRRGGGNH